jgi:hypothetical protein
MGWMVPVFSAHVMYTYGSGFGYDVVPTTERKMEGLTRSE